MPYDQEEDSDPRTDALEIYRKQWSGNVDDNQPTCIDDFEKAQESTQYLNDLPFKSQAKDDIKNLQEAETFERQALGAHSTNIPLTDKSTGDDGPKILSTNLTDEAKDWLSQLE